MSETLIVNGMTCGGCAASVERAIRALAPDRETAIAVSVDLASRRVTVALAGAPDPRLNRPALVRAITDAGFDVAA